MGLFNRQTDATTPSTSAGSPAYDASIHPANAGLDSVIAGRLQQQRDLHTFYDKSAAAASFSHYHDSQPSAVAVAMMGLARQRDLVLEAESRKWDLPFPGVHLGNLPSFSASPSMTPMLGGVQQLTHHAHQVESLRASRARFGR